MAILLARGSAELSQILTDLDIHSRGHDCDQVLGILGALTEEGKVKRVDTGEQFATVLHTSSLPRSWPKWIVHPEGFQLVHEVVSAETCQVQLERSGKLLIQSMLRSNSRITLNKRRSVLEKGSARFVACPSVLIGKQMRIGKAPPHRAAD